MNIIVIGCGRVGSALGIILSADGHNVTIIDDNEKAFDILPSSFSGRKVVGIGFDTSVLKEAGIELADAVAVVTPSDNINIMVAETVRNIFGIQNVVVRIFAPRKKKTYDRLNLRSVCPTTVGAYQVYTEILAAKAGSNLPLNNGDFQLLEVPLRAFTFETYREFEKDLGCKVVGVRTNNRFVFPWLGEQFKDLRSWILLAPTSHLRSIVEILNGGH